MNSFDEPVRHTAIAMLCMMLAGSVHAGDSTFSTNAMPGTTRMFIDTHVHFHAVKEDALDSVFEWMTSNKIERVINHPLRQSLPKNDAERVQMLTNYKKYEGVIERFCIMEPGEVDTVEEAVVRLEREKADGAIGFGEHYGRGLTFDDPKNLLLFEACEKVGLPVMFHMDKNNNLDDKGLPRLENVLKQFPECIFIAHSDWWRHLGDGTCDRLLQTYPNLYADISCTRRSPMRDPKTARAFIIRNADKLLFGSDSGWWTARMGLPPEFEYVPELDLPADVEVKLLRHNASKLFPRRTGENAPDRKSD